VSLQCDVSSRGSGQIILRTSWPRWEIEYFHLHKSFNITNHQPVGGYDVTILTVENSRQLFSPE
jgi:hypothetical protein